jgi:ABC-type lipoprotein export system ATPase subunit
MNFVMDRTVEEFLAMHAQCRMVHEGDKEEYEEKVRAIIEYTNSLTGEPVFPNTPLTSLSGGQSRALMIADTVFLSTSPILLIDEIENAGINRRKAISLLENRGKIVLIATHDPILALMANRRVILAHGGIRKVIKTSAGEKARLHELEKMDLVLNEYKERLRRGEYVS